MVQTVRNIERENEHQGGVDNNRPALNNAEVLKTASDVSAEIVNLDESGEILSMGNVSEEEGSVSDSASASQHGDSSVTKNNSIKGATVKALPSADVMVLETIASIDKLIEETLKRVQVLSKSKAAASEAEINSGIIEVRRLKGIRFQLHNVTNLAKEYILGLWKQFVKRQG